MDERLITLKCDVCGKQATKWYGFTSSTLCDNPKCYETTHKAFKEYEKSQLEEGTIYDF